MLGIENEVDVFISACLAGNLICLVYYAVRIFRRIIKHSVFLISMEDLLFWTVIGLYLFSEIYRTCSGNIRWYFVLGVLIGGGTTLLIMEKLKKIIDKTNKTS